jgi:hypothetical protein
MAGSNAKALGDLLDSVKTDNFAVGSMLAQLREQTIDFNAMKDSMDSTGKATILKTKEDYENSSVRQIILVFDVDQYALVNEALGDYCDKNGISSNTEAIVNLLQEQGYHVTTRQEDSD